MILAPIVGHTIKQDEPGIHLVLLEFESPKLRNLRLSDNAIITVIAKSECTFHQKHQGTNIQCDGNYNLNHGSNHLLMQS